MKTKKVALSKQLQVLIATNSLSPAIVNLVPPTAASPVVPTKAPTINLKEAENSNFSLFYEHEGEEFHLIFFMCKY